MIDRTGQVWRIVKPTTTMMGSGSFDGLQFIIEGKHPDIHNYWRIIFLTPPDETQRVKAMSEDALLLLAERLS